MIVMLMYILPPFFWGGNQGGRSDDSAILSLPIAYPNRYLGVCGSYLLESADKLVANPSGFYITNTQVITCYGHSLADGYWLSIGC